MQIIKANKENPSYWYNKYTGVVFPVESLNADQDGDYKVLDMKAFIRVADCIPVSITVNTPEKILDIREALNRDYSNAIGNLAAFDVYCAGYQRKALEVQQQSSAVNTEQKQPEGKELIGRKVQFIKSTRRNFKKGEEINILKFDTEDELYACYSLDSYIYHWLKREEFELIDTDKTTLADVKKVEVEEPKKHEITEEQIKELSECFGMAGNELLKKWYPHASAFKPKRTYKVGQVFKDIKGRDTVTICRKGYDVFLLHSNYRIFDDYIYSVGNYNAITEEELETMFDGWRKDFKLIE